MINLEKLDADKQAAWDRGFELLDRIDMQCNFVGHPVGGIIELKQLFRAALQAHDPLLIEAHDIMGYLLQCLKVNGSFDRDPDPTSIHGRAISTRDKLAARLKGGNKMIDPLNPADNSQNQDHDN